MIAIAAALLLTGCGMKGPLYLPDKNARVVTTPAAAPAATPPASEAPAQPNPTPTKRDDKDQDSQAPK